MGESGPGPGPAWAQGSSAHLSSSIKSLSDKWQLVPAFLSVRGLVRQHIDSFNYFIATDLKNIVRANDKVISNADPAFYLKYLDVHVGPPGKKGGNKAVKKEMK